jgi:hypothetical protein
MSTGLMVAQFLGVASGWAGVTMCERMLTPGDGLGDASLIACSHMTFRMWFTRKTKLE